MEGRGFVANRHNGGIVTRGQGNYVLALSGCTAPTSSALYQGVPRMGSSLWLAFVFLGDLGLMGTAITMRLPIDQLLWLSLANPLQTFKMAAILDINATLDLLGPAGIYAMQEYGAQLRFVLLAIMAAWIALPAAAAYLRFNLRGDL